MQKTPIPDCLINFMCSLITTPSIDEYNPRDFLRIFFFFSDSDAQRFRCFDYWVIVCPNSFGRLICFSIVDENFMIPMHPFTIMIWIAIPWIVKRNYVVGYRIIFEFDAIGVKLKYVDSGGSWMRRRRFRWNFLLLPRWHCCFVFYGREGWCDR